MDNAVSSIAQDVAQDAAKVADIVTSDVVKHAEVIGKEVSKNKHILTPAVGAVAGALVVGSVIGFVVARKMTKPTTLIINPGTDDAA